MTNTQLLTRAYIAAFFILLCVVAASDQAYQDLRWMHVVVWP